MTDPLDDLRNAFADAEPRDDLWDEVERRATTGADLDLDLDRRRPPIGRVLAAAAAVVLVAGLAVTLRDSVPSETADVDVAPTEEWGRVEHPAVGSIERPPGWHVQRYDDQCRIGESGLLLTNLDRDLERHDAPNECTTAWDLTGVGDDFVAVEVSAAGGGRLERSVTLPDTPLPIGINELERIDDRSSGLSVVAGGQRLFTVRVWLGADAPGVDRATAERVLASWRWACPLVPDDAPVFAGYAVTYVPDGFAIDGALTHTSTGDVDAGGEGTTTLRLRADDGRVIEVIPFGSYDPGAFVERAHGSNATEEVQLRRCNEAFTEPFDHRATVSTGEDRIVVGTQEWEYGGYVVTGTTGNSVGDLVAVAGGMRMVSEAGCSHDVTGSVLRGVDGASWGHDYAYVPDGADDRAELLAVVCGPSTVIERGPPMQPVADPEVGGHLAEDDRLDYAFTTVEGLWLRGTSGAEVLLDDAGSAHASPDGSRVTYSRDCECLFWEPMQGAVHTGERVALNTFAPHWSPNAAMRAGVVPIDDEVPTEVVIVDSEDDVELRRASLGVGPQVVSITWLGNEQVLAGGRSGRFSTSPEPDMFWVVDASTAQVSALEADGARYVLAEQSAADGPVAAIRIDDRSAAWGWLSIADNKIVFDPASDLPTQAGGETLDLDGNLHVDARSGVGTWLLGDGTSLFEIDADGTMRFLQNGVSWASAP